VFWQIKFYRCNNVILRGKGSTHVQNDNVKKATNVRWKKMFEKDHIDL